MKNFLVTLDKENNSFTIIKQSNKLQILEEKDLLVLFTGQDASKVNNILTAYQSKGIELLQDLKGAFSCLIYDKRKKELFIAKDKVGIAPLYFADTAQSIIVGTHLKDFKEIQDFEPVLNPSSVGDYLQFGFILQPNTIFKDCHKVCSGEYICFDLKNHRHASTKYWKLESCYQGERNKKDKETILKETQSLLQKAVEKNTQNTLFGVSLSGGYDSSTLAAITQAQSDKKVDTFTIGFHEQSINEAPHAKAIAKHLGTNHTEYYFSDKDALELIPKMCQVYDEPFADHASTPTMLTSLLLKNHKLNNLIAGDGGDEVFATAEDVNFFHRLEHSPIALKKLFASTLSAIPINKLPYFKNLNNLPKKQHKLIELLLAQNIPQMVYSKNTLFREEELQMSLKNYTKPLTNSFDAIHFSKETQTVNQVIGSYFKTTMVDGELMKSYAAMNQQNIQLSTPFLDIKLVEYLATVPSSIKIKNNIKKYLLKEIAHSYIPKALIARPKSGFDIPFSKWMRGILKDILHEQINKKRLDEDNIFYTASILNIRDQFYIGNDAYKYKLWRIFIFQLWYENFKKTNQ